MKSDFRCLRVCIDGSFEAHTTGVLRRMSEVFIFTMKNGSFLGVTTRRLAKKCVRGKKSFFDNAYLINLLFSFEDYLVEIR